MDANLDSLKKNTEGKMKKAIDFMLEEFKTIRTGRANASLLDPVVVDSYGQKMKLKELGTITTPDAHTIVVDPWDKSSLTSIQKAIESAGIGLNPSSDGKIIRVPIPSLTEERRKEFVKVAKKKSEECKIAVRNIRREANENTKKIEKEQSISEDIVKKVGDDFQKMTDKYIKEIDTLLDKKEKEILEV